MTIMFAGGMTIAIPGETPVAVAQTGMLSVSATAAPGNSFGGPQVIEIEVNDPTRSETDTTISQPHVTVDGADIDMVQADTGKWYAYFASDTPVRTNTLLSTANTALDSPPTAATTTRTGNTQDDLIMIQEFDFTDDSNIDIVLGGETITLHYEEDLDDLATVSTDRTNGVPIGGQVHVTISDFRLNLDPTEADVWYMNASSSSATYGTTDNVADTDDNALPNTEAALEVDWNALFGGKGGEFTLTDPMATISDIDVTGDGEVDASDNIVRFEETGANTGVFTSENDDVSNIKATGAENDDFTIAYADSDVQVFIEDFDSTLEVIADGTWDSGESLTVRLTNENLNTNTLTEQDMGIGDDNLPVLMIGTPITLTENLDSPGTYDDNDDSVGGTNDTATPEVPRGTITVGNAYVGALNIPDISTTAENAVNFTIPLSGDNVRQINSGDSYVHYMGPDVTVTGINGTETIDIDDSEDAPSLTAVVEIGDDDITLNYTASTTGDVPIIFDIFTFGEAESHSIYRALLEETDSASGVFEGTIEYQMLNQRTADEAATHQSVDAVGNELAMILDTGYTGSDAPEFTYDGGQRKRGRADEHR